MKRLLVILLALVCAAPVSALAADWNMYGSARLKMFYEDNSKEANDGVNSDTDLDMDLVSNSRIGANVKVSDQVGGRFEYGTGVNLRLLYGDWRFGSGTLRFGQDYTPMSGGTSNQVYGVDDNLNSVGAVDGPRSAQIKLIMGGLQVALVENSGVNNYADTTIYTATDKVLPKIEASYEFANDTLSIMPFAGYQAFDIESTGTGQESKTIASFMAGVHGRINLGAAYVNFSGHWAQNGGDYGLFSLGSATTARLVNDDIEDSTGYGCALVVGFKPSETLQLEAGIGYVSAEVDSAADETTKDDTMAYYVNAVITLAPGVMIVPEIGVYDYGDLEVGSAKTDQGQLLYYGAKFQINF